MLAHHSGTVSSPNRQPGQGLLPNAKGAILALISLCSVVGCGTTIIPGTGYNQGSANGFPPQSGFGAYQTNSLPSRPLSIEELRAREDAARRLIDYNRQVERVARLESQAYGTQPNQTYYDDIKRQRYKAAQDWSKTPEAQFLRGANPRAYSQILRQIKNPELEAGRALRALLR